MAWDDPVVLILILVVVVFLFGASRIPGLAKSLGLARREFDKGWKGDPSAPDSAQAGAASSNGVPALDDPLVQAAQREGIVTQGKTREQIASELSWKLNKK